MSNDFKPVVALGGGPVTPLGTISSMCEFGYVKNRLLDSLSSDKRKLPFVDSVGSLLLADLDKAKVTTILASAANLTDSDLCNNHVTLSPDSKRVALESCALGPCDTYVVDLEGNVLASDPGAGNVGYSFSPDSSLLEHHNSYGLRVLSIKENALVYSKYVSSGEIRDTVWIDGRRVVVPISYGPEEQIVSIR